jgi:hypothetical protein
MTKSKLLSKWEAAREDLGLEIIAPFCLKIGNKVSIQAEFLVKNFGASNGMLVVTDYAMVEGYGKQLSSLGYGFSVLEEPSNKANEAYDREIFIGMLSEWGWSGVESEKPDWIIEPVDPE